MPDWSILELVVLFENLNPLVTHLKKTKCRHPKLRQQKKSSKLTCVLVLFNIVPQSKASKLNHLCGSAKDIVH